MSNRVYPSAIDTILDGSIDWDSDTLVAGLFDALVYDSGDVFLDDLPTPVATETVTGAAIISGDVLVDNTMFTGVSGGDILSVVVWKDTGSSATSPLLFYTDDEGEIMFSPAGGDIEVSWNGGVLFRGLPQTVGGYETLNAAILDAAPIGYWRLDDDTIFTDYGSGGNDGTKIGTLVEVAGLDSSDPDNGALDFNNAGMVSTGLTGFSALSAFSVECIVELETHVNGDAIWAITTAPGGVFVGPTLAAGPVVRFDIYNNEITGLTTFPSSALMQGPAHLVYVCTTDDVWCYINGGLVWHGTVADFGDIQGTFCIGGSLNGGGTLIPDATIDEVAV